MRQVLAYHSDDDITEPGEDVFEQSQMLRRTYFRGFFLLWLPDDAQQQDLYSGMLI